MIGECLQVDQPFNPAEPLPEPDDCIVTIPVHGPAALDGSMPNPVGVLSVFGRTSAGAQPFGVPEARMLAILGAQAPPHPCNTPTQGQPHPHITPGQPPRPPRQPPQAVRF